MISTIRLYIHQIPGEPQVAMTCDMSGYPNMFGAMLGYYDVQVEWPEVQANPTVALIAQYERQIEQERAEHNDRVGALMGQINSLRCIEHKDAEQ